MHFVAGPWFTVIEEGNEQWVDYGRVWLSDGYSSGPATLQYRVKFADRAWPDGGEG